MDIKIWSAFVLTATVVLIIPGPTIILVISQAIAHGRKSALPLTVGVTLGDFTAMTLSLMGLGALLSSSAVLFSVLKWIGAIYLILTGIRLWLSKPKEREIRFSVTNNKKRSLFGSAFIVTALNPKSIAFFIAFLPQFVNKNGAVFPQLLILGSTFLFLASINAALYALFAGQLRDTIQNTRACLWLDRLGGSALIGTGILTATLRRSA
jgi:threonine/homoserine/homoserine lactone efflux protein